MFSSPAKRRRTSPSSFVSVGANGDSHATVSNPSTPRRASYLSPTKASLARSHPRILSQTRRTRLSEPRNNVLRNEVISQLAQSKEQQVVSRAEPVPVVDEPVRTENTSRGSAPGAAPFDFADVVANAFSTAPKVARSPLSVRQPSTDQRSIDSSEKSGAVPIVPKLVTRNDRNPRAVSERRSADPELPPTPVQLGLDQAPERPRGLASSSSPGGSGRRRVRTRDGRITSSPLKPKEIAPTNIVTAEADIEIASGIGEDHEIETDARPHSLSDDDRIIAATDDLRQKQDTLQALKRQLREMTADLAKLRSLNTTIQQQTGKDATHMDEVIQMIQQEGNLQLPNPLDLESHPDFMKNPTAYLTLFAPGNLGLSHVTWTKQVRKRAKIVHQTTVHPLAPWPVAQLQLTFDITIDVADSRVETVTQLNAYSDMNLLMSSKQLQNWISSRLSHELHNKDLGTLVWGSGRYFEECVKRAKVLKYLSDIYEKKSSTEMDNSVKTSKQKHRFRPADTFVADQGEAFSLLPFLGRTQTMFEGQNSKGNTMQKKLMLLYEIEFSWTGSAKTTIEIVASGMPAKASRAAEEVFDKAMKTHDVIGAFEAVWSLLGMGSAAGEESTTSLSGKRKLVRAS